MNKINTVERHARHQAMWLVAHLRAVSAEPLPFKHKNYRLYLSDLQRQYDSIRTTMDPEAGRAARIAGRALVRQYTLKGIAGGVFPVTPGFGVTGRPTAVRQEENIDTPRTGEPVASGSAVDRGASAASKRDLFNCRRKLCHRDYLSALAHMVRLGDRDLHAYPCELCGASTSVTTAAA